MATTEQEPLAEALGKVADVTRDALDSQLRIGTEVAELAQRALEKGSDPVEVGRSYLSSAWREAGNYWQAVADLNIQYATQLIKVGSQAVGSVVSEVNTAIEHSRPQTETPDATAKAPAKAPAKAAAARSTRRKPS